MEVTYALGAEMLMLAGVASKPSDAWRMMRDAIGSGRALQKFAEIIEAQGGNPRIIENQDLLTAAPVKTEFVARPRRIRREVAPRAVGYGIIAIRGGRRTMEDKSIHPLDSSLLRNPAIECGAARRSRRSTRSTMTGSGRGSALWSKRSGSEMTLQHHSRWCR